MRAYLEFCVRSRIFPTAVEDVWLEVIRLYAQGDPRKKLTLWPREHLKSSESQAFGTFLLACPQSHVWGPQVRYVIASETKGFAQRTVKAIKKSLEANPYVTGLSPYGTFRPSKSALKRLAEEYGTAPESAEWSVKEGLRTILCVAGEIESGHANEEPSCWAQGMTEASTGKRFDVLDLDDPVGGSSYNSPIKRDRTRETYSELNAQASSNAMIRVKGTRWHEDDIHNTILTEYHDEFSIHVTSIWGSGPEWSKDDFVKGEDGLYRLKNEEDFKRAEVHWPGFGQIAVDAERGGVPEDEDERKRLALHYARARMESRSPRSWAAQFLNRCIAMEDQLFHRDMFQFYHPGRPWMDCRTYILTDSATGQDFRSSYRVVAAVTLDARDVAYVRELKFGRWDPEVYCEHILEMSKKYAAQRVLMEKMSFQEVFKSVLRLVAESKGLPMPRVADVSGRSLVSKVERIEGLLPRFSSGRIQWNPALQHEPVEEGNSSVMEETIRQFCRVQELTLMGKGVIVDIPDAISDIDALDRDGQRYCLPPRPNRVRVAQTSTMPTQAEIQGRVPKRSKNNGRFAKNGPIWSKRR